MSVPASLRRDGLSAAAGNRDEAERQVRAAADAVQDSLSALRVVPERSDAAGHGTLRAGAALSRARHSLNLARDGLDTLRGDLAGADRDVEAIGGLIVVEARSESGVDLDRVHEERAALAERVRRTDRTRTTIGEELGVAAQQLAISSVWVEVAESRARDAGTPDVDALRSVGQSTGQAVAWVRAAQGSLRATDVSMTRAETVLATPSRVAREPAPGSNALDELERSIAELERDRPTMSHQQTSRVDDRRSASPPSQGRRM